MTKLVFTCRLIRGQGTVGGSFQRPTSHLGPFYLPHYLSHVVRRIRTGLFSHLPLFFPFSFISLHWTPPYSCCCGPPREWTLMLFPVTGVRWVLSPHPLFLSAFLDGAGGLHQARTFYSKCSSVLPFTTCCLLIYWGLFCKRNTCGGGGEGKLLKTKNLSFGFKRLMNNGGLWFLCKWRSKWSTATNDFAFCCC